MRIIVNFSGDIRYDEMEGRQFLVAPMIMLTEGVHNGSEGPLYYPPEEIAKTPEIWNMKPIVVYHPAAGQTACDPVIISNRKIGVIMNAHVEEIKINKNGTELTVPALKAEAWLEETRMAKIDERVGKAIESGEMMELSTGLFTDNETCEEQEWNGEKYTLIARNYRPDHLALLPDMRGACSVEDGGGFLRVNANKAKMVLNAELSHGNIRSMLNSWVQQKSSMAWIETVYNKSFIYEDGPKFYKRDYEIKDNTVIVNSMEGMEVVRVTEWRTKVGNKFVGNKTEDNQLKGQKMSKEKKIDAIIKSNLNSWGEGDKEILLAMNDAAIDKMSDSDVAAKTAVDNAAQKATEENVTVNVEDKKKTEDKKETAVVNEKPKTTQEYIDEAPKEIGSVLNGMMATHKNIKTALIKKLTDNEKCQMTEQMLETKDLQELRMLVNMLPGDEKVDEEEIALNYSGQADSITNDTQNTQAGYTAPKVMSAEIKK